MACRELISMFHQRPNGRRSSVQNRYGVVLYDAPDAVGLGIIESAFKHDTGQTMHERPEDNVAVSRYPANVGSTPVNVLIPTVKDPFLSSIDMDQVASGAVDCTLRLSSRSRSIQDVQRMRRLHRNWLEKGRCFLHHFIPPLVPT